MQYKGAVLNINDNPTLFVRKTDGEITDGMVISDIDGIYTDMKNKCISCVFVQFKDGTLPKNIEDFWEEENWNENIFFTIIDLKFITIVDVNKKDVFVDQILKQGDLNLVLNSLFDDKDIFNIDPETIDAFKDKTAEDKKSMISNLVNAVKIKVETKKKRKSKK